MYQYFYFDKYVKCRMQKNCTQSYYTIMININRDPHFHRIIIICIEKLDQINNKILFLCYFYDLQTVIDLIYQFIW